MAAPGHTAAGNMAYNRYGADGALFGDGGLSGGRPVSGSGGAGGLGLGRILAGSSFFYSLAGEDAGDDRGGLRRLTAWGELAASRFSGADGQLELDGEVNTAVLGADAEWGRWLAGVAVSFSEGSGDYWVAGGAGGAIDSDLASVNPYVHYAWSDRVSLWGTLGYGTGRLSLRPAGSDAPLETDLSNAMAAFGGRGVLSVLEGEAGRFELSLRSDALLTRTTSEAVAGLSAGEGSTRRLRLLLEGSGSLPAFGGVLTPRLEAGVRHDAGDAENGAGFEVGGGLGWSAGLFSVQVDGRRLLAHDDAAYEESGYSASLAYRLGGDGRGLSLNLGSSWGAVQSGVQRLWDGQDGGFGGGFGGSSGGGAPAPLERRLQAEIGYGLGVRRLWYPYLAADAGGDSRAMRFGLKLSSGDRLDAGLELGRRESGPQTPAEDGLMLRGQWRF